MIIFYSWNCEKKDLRLSIAVFTIEKFNASGERLKCQTDA